MAPQRTGDLGLIQSLPSQRRDHVSFFRGDLVILHTRFPLLSGVENREVSQVTLVFKDRVALTL